MALLDDILGNIAAAVGPRGVDMNDPNAPPRLRVGPRGPASSPVGSSTGYNGNSRVGKGDDGMFLGSAPPPLPPPDDRYAHQRRAQEYSDPHQATQHLRDVNSPGPVTGTVKTGGTGASVAPGSGAAPPTSDAAATGMAATISKGPAPMPEHTDAGSPGPNARVAANTNANAGAAALRANPMAAADLARRTGNPTPGSLLRVPQYQPPDMARRAELERQRTAAMTPTDPNAPGIKPSIWRRLGAVALGTAAGFGRNGGNPDAARQVASSIVGAKFNAAERARQANLGKINQQISDFDTEANEEDKNFENSLKQNKAAIDVADENRANKAAESVPKGNEVLGPDGKTPGYYTESGKFVVSAPGAAKPGAGDKLNEEYDARTTEANRLGLKGAARTRFIATGKIESDRTPGQGENEYRDWVAQWRREHSGQAPSAQAIQRYKAGLDPDSGTPVKPTPEKRGTAAQFAKLEADKKKALDATEAEYRDNAPTQQEWKNHPDRARQDDAAAKTKLEQAKRAAQDAYEQQIVALGGSVSGKGQQPQAGQQSAKRPGSTKQSNQAGPSVSELNTAKARVPAGRILVWDIQAGKFQHVPRAEAQQARDARDKQTGRPLFNVYE